jgi:hypothetical protein
MLSTGILLYSLALAVGLVMVAGAIYSLLRSFTPGSQKRPQGATSRLITRGSVYSLGLGLAVTGAVGLIARLLLHTTPSAGFIVAAAAGLVVGLIALFLLVYWPSRGRAEEVALHVDATGRQAHVVITIPANGLGEITFPDGREHLNLGARSASGLAIPAGTSVVIRQVNRRIAVVAPADDSLPEADMNLPPDDPSN